MTNPSLPLPGASDAAAPAESIVPKPGWWEDYADVFVAPSLVFARRAKADPWVPMLLVSLAMGALYLANADIIEPLLDTEWRRALESRGINEAHLTGEDADSLRRFTHGITRVFAFLSPPVMILLLGWVLFLSGKLVRATGNLHAAVVVAAYSCMPRVLESVLTSVQGLFLDPAMLDGRYRLTYGVARFIDPATMSPLVLGAIARIDVFTIWQTVLLAIGLAVTGGIPRWRAAIAAVVVWIAGGVAMVGPSLLR